MNIIRLTKVYINNHNIGFEFTSKDFMRFLGDNGIIPYKDKLKNIPEGGVIYNKRTAKYYLNILRGAGYLGVLEPKRINPTNRIIKHIPEDMRYPQLLNQYKELRNKDRL